MNPTNFFFAQNDLLSEKSEKTSTSNHYFDRTTDERDFEVVNPTGTQVFLLSESEGELKSLWLPEPPEGKYFFEDNFGTSIKDLLYIEERSGKWSAHCNRPLHFKDVSGEIRYIESIYDKSLYQLECFSKHYVLYTEFTNPQSTVFRNYRIKRFDTINIGRSKTNDIVYPTPQISRFHAILQWNKGWEIKDCNSANGVYVNGARVNSQKLKSGDSIFIMGLQIIIGIGYISINDGNNRVEINHAKIELVNGDGTLLIPEAPRTTKEDEELFNRFPRHRKSNETTPISFELPPLSLDSTNIPMLLRMGGPMVMSSTALLAGNITTMLSSVLFPILTQRYTDKQKKEYEELRFSKYKEYLSKKEKEIESEISREEKILNENYPPLAQALSFPDSKKRLWERRKTDDDFLLLRIGHGALPMMAAIDYPSRRFDLENDELVEAMYKIAEKQKLIKDVPIMTSLVEDFVCGVLGSREIELSFVKQLIMQITLLHSYDEVKLVLISSKEELKKLNYIRYLPHFWNDQKDFRFLATSESEAYQISEYLKKEVAGDLETDRPIAKMLSKRPFYVVFALDKKIYDSMEFLKDVMQSEKCCGISVISVYDDLPKECSKIFSLSQMGYHSVIYLKQIEKENDSFRFDTYEEISATSAMKKISNLNLKVLSEAYSLPKSITFLEMFGVGRISHLNPLKRWKENDPVKSLAAPIGVGTDGSLFNLDLHEKFQGPHGLVAGMTGSGKSEFIITYILSMAVNYHPDEVAFILIDYKGGGLAGAFVDEERGIHLPHVIGTITNLDGSAIQRSLMSIQSELTRRQTIFNEVKSISNEGTMDIYTYQKLYRQKKVDKPLPHLFIISDEFAELKKQEPEFMDQLISAARIGRSLGVHLILATQKPSGVVDEQIWSNSKFRICLKVQDRSDSYEMLKRPEAAELKETGRFYLQVGYNEFFALGQSGWCGASYEPTDHVAVQKDDELQILDHLGQPIVKGKPQGEKKAVKSEMKQVVAIVKALSDLAIRENIHPRPMWCEPLSKQIGLDDIKSQYHIDNNEDHGALIGVVDDPMSQRQFPLFIDLKKNRNLLVAGESGSGKTTLLQTLLYSMISDFSPEEVNFYVMDFSSRNLSLFNDAPHCGYVLTDADENAVIHLFELYGDIINERRKLFAEAQVSSYEAYIQIAPLPLVFLVIDNIAGFDEMNNRSDILNMLGDFMTSGVGYGCKVIFTISQINDCSYRIRNQAGNRIALRAKDRFSYSDILECRCQYEPTDTPGRGMCTDNVHCYEYQTALIVGGMAEQERAEYLKKRIQEIAATYPTGMEARSLDIADTTEEYAAFCKKFRTERIPLGYRLDTMKKVALPLQQLRCMSIYFGHHTAIPMLTTNLLYSMIREKSELIVVKRQNNSVFTEEYISENLSRVHFITYPSENERVTELLNVLSKYIFERKVYREQSCQENNLSDWRTADSLRIWRKDMRRHTKPVFVYFESFADICLNISIENAAMLDQFFQMCCGFNIYFIGGFYPDDNARIQKETHVEEETTDQLEPSQNDANDSEEEEITPAKRRKKELRQILGEFRSSFVDSNVSLLFGGQFDKQMIMPTMPHEWKKITNPCSSENDNNFLLSYQNGLYSLMMPCGDLQDNDVDEDEDVII